MTPEQQLLFDDLTELQRRTATGVLAGMSNRAAYYAAGGTAKSDQSADSAASTMLSNVKVKAFMDAMKLQAVSDAIMTREEALKTLSLIGRTHLKDIVKFRTINIGKDMETGADLNQTAWEINADLQETDSDKLIIISELEVGKNGPKIKTHSPVAAIKQLAEMQGWNAATKHEITGKNGGPIMTSHSDFYADDDDDGEGEP